MTWQTRLVAVTMSIASLTGFDKQGCASPITARLIRNGQAYRAMRVKFPARVLNRLDPTTAEKQDWITCLIGIYHQQVRLSFSVRLLINLQQPISSMLAAQPTGSHVSSRRYILNRRIIVQCLGVCQVHSRKCYTATQLVKPRSRNHVCAAYGQNRDDPFLAVYV